ncbi:hypothetical protein BU25DRAFT_124991 [Macroventuria anomochaeta]|uniref:Uncharacterized protein n=1 Tax=Macroventuria anomochaeta TaxID=301207 RepID=A0ACB6RTG2_9PLEO|nr:uncharacterized protein BU25DRAFT_124991 [Macroventuria anomochaeta]KAF2625211.1 hypothetical protein BU25DRAFT_124991 [Macroventuria anomochaeta]
MQFMSNASWPLLDYSTPLRCIWSQTYPHTSRSVCCMAMRATTTDSSVAEPGPRSYLRKVVRHPHQERSAIRIDLHMRIRARQINVPSDAHKGYLHLQCFLTHGPNLQANDIHQDLYMSRSAAFGEIWAKFNNLMIFDEHSARLIQWFCNGDHTGGNGRCG